MSNIKDMVYALRRCAFEHENDNTFTGQIVVSSLCRDVADYLENRVWHYPSKGDYPTEKELVLMKIPGCYVLGWYEKNNWFMDDGELTVLKCTVSRWQYIEPPKEEA